MYNCDQSRQRKKYTNGQPKLYAMENAMKDFHVDDSQQIHKYDNIGIKKSNKTKIYFSYQRKWRRLKVCTSEIKYG